MQENHDEDPEVMVSTATESPEAQTVRQAVLGTGRKVRASVHQASRIRFSSFPSPTAAMGALFTLSSRPR